MSGIPPNGGWQEPPQSMPPVPPVQSLGYQSVRPTPHGNAPMLVNLAVIFNYVAGGLHFLSALGHVAAVIFMQYTLRRAATGPAAAGPPPAFMWVMYGAMSFGALCAAIVSVIGGWKLQSRGAGAFGWGLAAGIANLAGLFWCSIGCVLPIGAGIYTIVIVCLEPVRAYLSVPRQN